MSDDTVVRLFAKLDNITERLARIETMNDIIEKDICALQKSIAEHGRRVGDLEQAKAGAISIKEFVAWGVAIAAVLWGMMK